MSLKIEKISPAMGAMVTGTNLSAPLSELEFSAIEQAFCDHLLLVFPDQSLTPEQHIAFSRRFGELAVHPTPKYLLDDFPEILLLSNRRNAAGNYVSLRDGGSVWHSDHSYLKTPSTVSLLYAREVPADGGDTEWANMYRAYETLPGALKRRIDKLRAVHDFDQVANPRIHPPEEVIAGGRGNSIWEQKSVEELARKPPVVHPLVRVHPRSGRPALYVNRRFTIRIEGLAPDESETLLLDLFDHAENRANVYHHHWSPSQLLMWDNRCTIHLACGGVPDDQIRTMHRTTVRGEATA